MKDWAPYHQEINKNLDSLSKDPAFIAAFKNNKYTIFERLFTRGTFLSRMPINDAWDIAKSHPLIVNIDYDKLLILSRVYKQQELTFKSVFEIFELFNSKDINIEKDAKSNLELISNRIQEFVALEKQLMYYYKQAEEILDLQDNEI